MAVQTRDQLKQWFQTRDKPTQEQFWDLIDSFLHAEEGIAIDNVEELTEALAGKVDILALESYALVKSLMILVEQESDLISKSPEECRFILVKDYAIVAALQTDELPNNTTTYASSLAGWLWQVVLQPFQSNAEGYVDRFAANADYIYAHLSGFSLYKIKCKPSVAMTIRIGTTANGEEIMFEETIPGGEWKTITIDLDAPDTGMSIYFTGITALINVNIYKLKL